MEREMLERRYELDALKDMQKVRTQRQTEVWESHFPPKPTLNYFLFDVCPPGAGEPSGRGAKQRPR